MVDYALVLIYAIHRFLNDCIFVVITKVGKKVMTKTVDIYPSVLTEQYS